MNRQWGQVARPPGARPGRVRPTGRPQAEPRAQAEGGVVIGRTAGTDTSGRTLVNFPGNPAAAPLPARRAVALPDTPCEVVLAFEDGDRRRPVVLGALAGAAAPRAEARVDGEAVVLEAGREIVLRCGEASITLTRAGKVIIRGTYVLSRSSGTNRIKGGSVQIN